MKTFLNIKNPFIYGFFVSLVALIIALVAPVATPNSVVVAFDTAGGTPVAMVTLPGGGKLSSIPTTTKEGYTFEGWLNGNQTVTLDTRFNTNTTLRADFVGLTFSIQYETNGGNLLDEDIVDYGDDLRLPIPTKDGAIFEGWYEDVGLTSAVADSLTVFKDYILYAKWSTLGQDVFTVSFFSEGLGLVDSLVVAPNTSITLITPPTRTGYQFVNWVDGITFQDLTSNTYTVTQDVVFFAKWIATGGLVTITFDSQGGTPVPSIQVPAGTPWQNPDTIPFLAEGYQFLNWITNCNFDGFEVSCLTLDESYIVEENITALARYDYMIPLSSMRFETALRNERVIGYTLVSVSDFVPEGVISTLVLPSRFSGLPVVAIGDYAFESAQYLDKVIIPDNVELIEYYAFANSSIKEVFLPRSLITIDSEAFIDSQLETVHFATDSQLTVIQGAAFRRTQITAIAFPASLEFMGDSAFRDTPLSSITFPSLSRIKYLGSSVFRNTELTSVTLPEGLLVLQSRAFENNPQLTTIHLPASLRYLGGNAFESTGLTEFSIGQQSQLRSVRSNLFGEEGDPLPPFIANHTEGYLVKAPLLIAYAGPYADGEAMIIPEDATFILDRFIPTNETLLKASITFPANLNYIGMNAFSGATFNSNVTLPDGVLVDENAFENVTIDGNLTIGAVRGLDSYAFQNLRANDVTLLPNPTYGDDALNDGIFSGATLTSLTLGEGYTELPYLFTNNSAITTMSFPDSITRINSFSLGSTTLTTLTFAGNGLLLDVQTDAITFGMRNNSPWYQANLPFIVLKNNLYKIDLSAMLAPYDLVIPDAVRVINRYAFVSLNGYLINSIDFNNTEFLLSDALRDNSNNSLNIENAMDFSQFTYIEGYFVNNVNQLISDQKIVGIDDFFLDVDYLIDNNGYVAGEIENLVTFNDQGFKILNNMLFEYRPSNDLTPNEVTIPEGVEWIDSSAFYNVSLPANFTLPSTLKYIGNNAFENVQFAGPLTLPNQLKVIQDYAFRNANLTEVTIPQSVIKLGYFSLATDSLTSVSFADVTKIMNLDPQTFGSFSYRIQDLPLFLRNHIQQGMVIVDGLLVMYVGYQRDVVIPEGVKVIGERAFEYRDYYVRSIKMPSTLLGIQRRAMSGLRNLRQVDFAPVVALTYIQEAVFEYSPLTSLVIAAPITMVHPNAFVGMPYLNTVSLNMVTPVFLFFSTSVDIYD